MAPSPTTDRPITRADLEASFRGVADEVEEVAEQQRNRVVIVAAVVVVSVIAVSFVLGRRRGQRNRTVVEVRRL